MRILFFSHYFPPEVNPPASRTYEHCARWAKQGHDVTVVTCVPNCPDGVPFGGYKNRWWPQVERVDGIRVVRAWTFLAANAGTFRRIVNYVSYLFSAVIVALFLRRPHVIVATSPQFFCGWAGVMMSWLKWRPLVLEIRDIWPESIEAVGAMKRGWLIRLLQFLERRMYAAAHCIVTVGDGYAARIREKCSARKPIVVISNGIDPDHFQAADRDEATRRTWGLENQFVCSYVGTIGMAHGLDVVIRAARLLRDRGRRDISFCLVGDGAERAGLQQRVRDEHLEDSIVFTGRLPREQIPKVLAASDACLVHLRKCELFGSVIPSKIFETMAMRRPIIMGVAGQALEIVTRARAGLPMVPESAESLVENVERLADDGQLARELGQAGRAFVVEHYDRNRLAQDYLDLLIRVAEAKHPARPPAASTNKSMTRDAQCPDESVTTILPTSLKS